MNKNKNEFFILELSLKVEGNYISHIYFIIDAIYANIEVEYIIESNNSQNYNAESSKTSFKKKNK